MRLDEIATVRSGVTRSDGETPAWFVPVGSIGSGKLDSESFVEGSAPARSPEKACLQRGDVIVALRGNSNTAAVVEADMIAGRSLFAALEVGIVRLTNDVLLPEYLAAYVNLPKVQQCLAAERLGSGAPRLPISALKEVEVPAPDKARQRAIVGLAKELNHEETLQTQIREARGRFFNGLLANAAEEPVPGRHPARVHERS